MDIQCQEIFNKYSEIEDYRERVKYINDTIHPFFISVWDDRKNINFEAVNKEGIYNYLFDMVSKRITNKINVNHMAITILESLEQSEENTRLLNRVHPHDEQTVLIKYAYRINFTPMVIRLLIQKHNADVNISGKVHASSDKNINQNVFQALLKHILEQQEICDRTKYNISYRIYNNYCDKLGTCFRYSDNLEYALTQHKDEKGNTFLDVLQASKEQLESTRQTRDLINNIKGNKVLKPYIKNWLHDRHKNE